MDQSRELGKTAYEAYCDGAGISGTSDGKPVPKFHELKPATQRGWIFVAQALQKKLRRETIEKSAVRLQASLAAI